MNKQTQHHKLGIPAPAASITMDEFEPLDGAERASLLASLEAAEAEIAAGDYDEINAETFALEFMAQRAAAKK